MTFPPLTLKRICIHWAAGLYTPSTLERNHYHFTVDAMGNVARGKFKPEDNIPVLNGRYYPLRNGYYAAHCGGGNSYAIGVALCGMSGYKSPHAQGKYPLTATQCESAWKFIAEQCQKYGISVTEDTVYTHYEFGKRNPESDSAGKIDITFLPHKPELKSSEVGNYIRDKIRWYLAQLNATPAKEEEKR